MNSAILQNPLTAARDSADRLRLQVLFPDLQLCSGSRFLGLRPYLDRCPERFFDRPIQSLMLSWLKDRDRRQRAQLQQYLVDEEPRLNSALHFLRQINAEAWHDEHLIEPARYNEYQVVRFIDQVLHPAYLRLSEAVLTPLVRPVAHFSRLDRGKPTDAMEIYNIALELSGSSMAPCVDAYNHTVRNGIGHGGITYLQNDIRYSDKRGNVETLDVWSVVRLCDDMVDTCNGLASAIKVFLILMAEDGYRLPHEALVEELVEETSTPWWTISGCIQTELPSSTQLIIYACPESRDVLKIQWTTIQTAVLAEAFAPGYDWYFLSLRGSKGWPGWASFDGERLRQIRESGAVEAHEYATALSDLGFLYVPTPSLPRRLGWLDTLLQSIRIHMPLAWQQFLEKLGVPVVLGRQARMHRNGWGYVMNGAVVMPQLEHTTAAAVIRANKHRIIRVAARTARSTVSPFSSERYLPLGYARIGVYTEDFRRRRLNSFGLGPQLVCTVQLQRIRRIRSPDIKGSTVEVDGNWRIAWNRAWIESGGKI